MPAEAVYTTDFTLAAISFVALSHSEFAEMQLLVIMKEMPAEAVCPTAFTLAAIPPVALSHYGFAKCNFSWMGMV